MSNKPDDLPDEYERNDRPRDLNGSKPLWHRQPAETTQAYEAFMAYLMSGKDRTHRTAANAVGKSVPLMERWSKQWSWRLRVASYEETYLLTQLDSWEAKREAMFDRFEDLADSALNVAEQRLGMLFDETVSETERIEMFRTLRPDHVGKLMETAARLKRQAVVERMQLSEAEAARKEQLSQEFADEMHGLLNRFVERLHLPAEYEEEARTAMLEVLEGAEA